MIPFDQTDEFTALHLETSKAYSDGKTGKASVPEATQSKVYTMTFGAAYDIEKNAAPNQKEADRTIVLDGISNGFRDGYLGLTVDPPATSWVTLPPAASAAMWGLWVEARAQGAAAAQLAKNKNGLARDAAVTPWVYVGVGAAVLGLLGVGAYLVLGRKSNPVAGRKPSSKGVPTAMIDFIVNAINVGVPEDEVRAQLEKRALKAGATATLARRCGAYAVWRHRKNQELYTSVMRGRF